MAGVFTPRAPSSILHINLTRYYSKMTRLVQQDSKQLSELLTAAAGNGSSSVALWKAGNLHLYASSELSRLLADQQHERARMKKAVCLLMRSERSLRLVRKTA